MQSAHVMRGSGLTFLACFRSGSVLDVRRFTVTLCEVLLYSGLASVFKMALCKRKHSPCPSFFLTSSKAVGWDLSLRTSPMQYSAGFAMETRRHRKTLVVRCLPSHEYSYSSTLGVCPETSHPPSKPEREFKCVSGVLAASGGASLSEAPADGFSGCLS